AARFRKEPSHPSEENHSTLPFILGLVGETNVDATNDVILSDLGSSTMNDNLLPATSTSIPTQNIVMDRQDDPFIAESLQNCNLDSVRLLFAKKLKQVTDDEVEEVIKDWLKTAPKRLRQQIGSLGIPHVGDEDMEGEDEA
ncbi:hypothetical protein Fcan01_22395, partial [Folsomia candida]